MHTHHFKLSSVKNLPDSEVLIEGEIEKDFIATCREEALKLFNEQANLPGFRPGQIPQDLLIKTVGEGAILAESAEIALGRSYSHIIEEAKLRPITRPQITITNLAPNAPLGFKIELAVEPEINLPDYKALAKDVLKKNAEAKQEAPSSEGSEDKPLVENTKEHLRVKLVEALSEATKFELPKRFIEAELDHILTHFKSDLKQANIDWDDYLKKAEKTEAEIRETWREHVVSRTKPEFILSKIAEKEGLKTYAEVFGLLEKAD